jgi:hypothetical protein
LSEAGYARASLIYEALRSLYAPVILLLCASGVLVCWQKRQMQLRLILPVLLMVLSCAAIVLIWETSPRYSHPVQFAVLMLASVGFLQFSKGFAPLARQSKGAFEVCLGGAAIISCWLLVSAGIFVLARSAKGYQFADPRSAGVRIEGKPATLESLHGFSNSWEGAIDLPAGTMLPATVTVVFPKKPVSGDGHLSVSAWLPDVPPKKDDRYQVVYTTGGSSETIPSAASGRISRFAIPYDVGHPANLTLSVRAISGPDRLTSAMRVGIGYVLAN